MVKGRLKLVLPRILLGSIFFLSGLNWFLRMNHLLPYSPKAHSFLEALHEVGWFWPLLKSVELAAGVLLLAGYLGPWVVLGLVPLTLAIVFFHLFLSPVHGAWLGYLAFALEITLLTLFRNNFRHMFKHPKTGLQ